MFGKLQTYYLLLAATCLLMMYLFPIAQIKTENGILDFNVNGIIYKWGEKTIKHLNYGVQILIPVISFLLLASALIFKKTNLQKAIGRISYILLFLMLLSAWLELNFITNKLLEDEIKIGYRGFYFPIASLAFVFLANRAIKREEEILKVLEQIKNK